MSTVRVRSPALFMICRRITSAGRRHFTGLPAICLRKHFLRHILSAATLTYDAFRPDVAVSPGEGVAVIHGGDGGFNPDLYAYVNSAISMFRNSVGLPWFCRPMYPLGRLTPGISSALSW